MTQQERQEHASVRARRPRRQRRRPGRARIGLFGNFGIGNLGNDASLEAVQLLLATHLPDADVVCYCPTPSVVTASLGIPAAEIRAVRAHRPGEHRAVGAARRLGGRAADVARALGQTRRLDALLIPGTGILDDFGGERPSGWPLTVLTWIAAARTVRTPSGLVSVGVGPLADPQSRRLARQAVRLATYKSVRDEGSQDFVAQIGAPLGPSAVVPDVALSLPAPPRAAARQPVVAVVVMAYRGWRPSATPGLADEHVENMAALTSWLLDEGQRVRLVCADAHDMGAVRAVEDRVRQRASGLAGDSFATIEVSRLRDLAALLASVEIVVATRYHSVVAALLAGTPVVSIGYAAKNDELMARAGLAAFCQHADSFDLALFQRQLAQAAAEREQLSARTSAWIEATRRQWADEMGRVLATCGLA